VFQVSSAEIKPKAFKIVEEPIVMNDEIDEFEDVEPDFFKIPIKKTSKTSRKSQSAIALEKKMPETNFQNQQDLENDFGKQ
jgi:hypothetical protein